MKIKNKLFTILALTSGSIAAIGIINKYIQLNATSKNLLENTKSLCYKWRLGNIQYIKAGTGTPLLLIHNLDSASNSSEWKQLITHLAETHTVYAIDLIGCGKSEKPLMVYTNYLFVQLISDFIKNVIGHRTDVIVSGESAGFVIMACHNNCELFNQIMLINPLSIQNFCKIPGKSAKLYRYMIDIPVLGTLLYHISCSKNAMKERFTREYFYNPYLVSSSMIDTCYESAHTGTYPKSLYASVKCNYTKTNIANALKKIDNSIYIVGGSQLEGIADRFIQYKEINPAIEYSMIDHARELPQLEVPAELLNVIQTFFIN